MAFGAFAWNYQGKNQVNRLIILGFQWHGFDQSQENGFDIISTGDTSMGHGYAVTQGGVTQLFPGTQALKDLP